MFGFLGPFQQFGRVLLDIIFVKQKTKPRMDARQQAGLCGFRLQIFAERVDAVLQCIKIHMNDVEAMLFRIRAQFIQIHLVSLDGIGRIASLQTQPGMVLAPEMLIGCYLFSHGMRTPEKLQL